MAYSITVCFYFNIYMSISIHWYDSFKVMFAHRIWDDCSQIEVCINLVDIKKIYKNETNLCVFIDVTSSFNAGT